MSFPAVNPLTAASRTWWIGESTTGNGGTPLQVMAKVWAAQAAIARSTPAQNTGVVASPAPTPQNNNISQVNQPFPFCTQAIFNGYAGETTDFWLSNYSGGINIVGSIGSYVPTHVFIWLGVNDNGLYDGPTYVTKTTSLVGLLKASFPSTQVTLVSELCNGEKWDTITGWGPNAQDGNIATQETSKQTVCTNLSLPYIDLRAWLLTVEQAENTVNDGGTIRGNAAYITADGIHPIVANSQARVAGQIYTNLTVA